MRKTLHIIGIIGIAITLSTIVLFTTHPRISLAPVYTIVSSTIEAFTDINTTFSGNIFIVPGSWTSLIVDNASLELQTNNGLQTTTTLSSGKLTLHLFSLFKKNIALDGLLIEGMTISIKSGDKQKGNNFDEQTNSLFDRVVELLQKLDFLKQTGNINITSLMGSIIRPHKTSTFSLDDLSGHLDQFADGTVTASGKFEGQQFTVNTEIGPLGNIKLLKPLPLSLRLSLPNINFGFKGQLDFSEENAYLTSSFSLSGENIGNLVSAFGYQNIPLEPLSIDGTITLSNQTAALVIKKMNPGSKNIAVTLSADGLSSGNVKYTLVVQGDELNLDQITGLIDSKEKTKQDKQPRVDNILFPDALSDINFDLMIDLKKITIGGRKVSDFEITISMQQGISSNSLLRARFEHSTVQGDLSLNFSSEIPQIAGNLSFNAWNVGETLESFHLAEGIDLYMENLISHYKTSGLSLGELITNLEFDIHADDGRYALHDKNTGATIEVAIDKASIIATPGNKTSVELLGTINEHQITITTILDNQRDTQKAAITSLPFSQTIKIAGTTLQLNGVVPLPYRMEGLTIQSSLSGNKISALNEVLQLDLPEVGPYTLTGTLEVIPDGYSLTSLDLHVGSSTLEGDFFLNTINATPGLLVELKAKTIQLSDFITAKPKATMTNSVLDTSQKKTNLHKHLTDQNIINKYNAKVSLDVNEVYFHDDFLGSGLINIVQKDGALAIAPLEISSPKGSFSLYFSIKPNDELRHYSLHTDIERLNYGVLGRWFKMDSDIEGLLDLHSSLTSTCHDFRDFMANASGTIEFSVEPEKTQSGVIDLWAVNLFSYLLPIFNPSNTSTLNCAAGQFDIHEGVLTQRNILIDTSRIQVKGTVEVDFSKDQVEALLRPVPKRPQFYSLATPVKIKGKITDFKVGLAKGGLIGTVIRIMTSYIVVPLQWIILEKIPEDGTKNCQQLVQPRLHR